MEIQFRRWGDSVALRVPDQLLEQIGAVEGMSADISVQNGLLVIKPMNDAPRYVLSELLAAITEENLHGEVDTGHAVGNECA